MSDKMTFRCVAEGCTATFESPLPYMEFPDNWAHFPLLGRDACFCPAHLGELQKYVIHGRDEEDDDEEPTLQ